MESALGKRVDDAGLVKKMREEGLSYNRALDIWGQNNPPGQPEKQKQTRGKKAKEEPNTEENAEGNAAEDGQEGGVAEADEDEEMGGP